MNRLGITLPNLAVRLWVTMVALFLSPDMTSERITRKTGRHRYTVFLVYDTDDGLFTESFHVLSYTPQEASERRKFPANGQEPTEVHIFKGWNTRVLTRIGY